LKNILPLFSRKTRFKKITGIDLSRDKIRLVLFTRFEEDAQLKKPKKDFVRCKLPTQN